MPRSGDPCGGAAAAPDPEERELLRHLRGGGREALATLIDRHGEGLMRYLHSILHDRHEAEEVFQDTWVRVVEKIGRFKPDRPFAPWLFRIARNGAYDRLRSRRRWRLLSLGEPVTRKLEDRGSAAEATSDALVARDLAGKLLPRLDAGSREMIYLRFYRECSYEEMAEICSIPLGTVKSRLSRALDRLGDLYEQLERTDHEEPAR